MRDAQFDGARTESEESGTAFVQDLDVDFVAFRPQLLQGHLDGLFPGLCRNFHRSHLHLPP